MTAFNDNRSSYLIQHDFSREQMEAETGSPEQTDVHYQIPDSCMPKSYDGATGRYIQATGIVNSLPVGKKATLRLYVNGQLESEKTYTSNGFICDDATGKEPPQANIKGGDSFYLELITDAVAPGIEFTQVKFNTYSGKIENGLCG